MTTLRPKKSLGQNFLVDPSHQARIIAAAELVRDDVVLEIGAGDGSLTALIAAQAGCVVAVELDERLIPILERRFVFQPHVTVLHGDILEVDISEAMGMAMGAVRDFSWHSDTGSGFKVIANLPYYITGAVIRRLLELTTPPGLLVLTIQREVAERMAGSPPRMSLLAVSVQFYCSVEIVDRIPASAFRPSPKVESATVRLIRHAEPILPGLQVGDFFKVVRAGFCQPRKQLRNSFALGMGVSAFVATGWLEAAGISPQRRAETLELEEWGRLTVVVTQESAKVSAAPQ